MKSVIVNIFNLILTIVISGIFWVIIIGFPSNADKYLGGATVFKQGIFSSVVNTSSQTYLSFSGTNGLEYSEKTGDIFNNAYGTSANSFGGVS